MKLKDRYLPSYLGLAGRRTWMERANIKRRETPPLPHRPYPAAEKDNDDGEVMSLFTFSIICHQHAIFPPHNPNKHLTVLTVGPDSGKAALTHQPTLNLVFGEKVGQNMAAFTEKSEKSSTTDRRKRK